LFRIVVEPFNVTEITWQLQLGRVSNSQIEKLVDSQDLRSMERVRSKRFHFCAARRGAQASEPGLRRAT
jgi:hypothetical protein